MTSQPELRPEKLIFIDESGFDVKMTRRSGRAQAGKPCLGAHPFGRWGNNTFIAGLRLAGTCAPMLMQGAMNGDWFCHWVETQLAPSLSEGDIVVCDNLSVHKNARARVAIEAKGAEVRFLPPYSPDLNPIEQVFAKIKGIVRSLAPRSFDTLCEAIKAALNAISQQECANYIQNAGYASN